MQNTKEYVDGIFIGYEPAKELDDFKEELTSNLNEKIASLVRKGMSAEEAFKKATGELGDISSLADEISLKKKQEVIGEAYMDIKQYMKPKRVAGYIAFGVLAIFAFFAAALTLLSDGILWNTWYGERLVAPLGVLLAFLPIAAAGFTWLGMTQEMADLFPLSGKRAAWYALAAFLLCSGIILFPLVYFSVDSVVGNSVSLISALASLLPFALPAIALLVFLCLTEKDRHKPWCKAWGQTFREAEIKKQYEFWQDGATATRFGMYSGAIWIAAIGVFILAGLLAGFRYSWLAFVFAIAVQLWVQGLIMPSSSSKRADDSQNPGC